MRYLTDGQYVQDIREMSSEDADITTGGDWWWATEPPASLVNA